MTVLSNTPEGEGPPAHHIRVGAADLPRTQRELTAAHLLAGVGTAAPAADGRYADGQRTMPSYYDPVEGPWQAPALQPSEEGNGSRATAPPSGGFRRRTRKAPSVRRVRQEDDACWVDFLRDFARRYRSKGADGRCLRAKYAAGPPPPLPKSRETLTELPERL